MDGWMDKRMRDEGFKRETVCAVGAKNKSAKEGRRRERMSEGVKKDYAYM